MAWLSDKIRSIVKAEMPKIVNRLITPDYIHDVFRDVFAKDHKRQLSSTGFGAAMALSLHDMWKDISVKECAEMMWEELRSAGIVYGDPDYDWSYSAAQDLAREYVSAYGETP